MVIASMILGVTFTVTWQQYRHRRGWLVALGRAALAKLAFARRTSAAKRASAPLALALLPIFAVCGFEAHSFAVSHVAAGALSLGQYLLIQGQMLAEALPLLFGQALVWLSLHDARYRRKMALLGLVLLVATPLVSHALTQVMPWWAQRQQLLMASAVLLWLAVALYWLNQWYWRWQGQQKSAMATVSILNNDIGITGRQSLARPWRGLRFWLNLDVVVLLVMLLWAWLMAGVFASHVDPMLHQPFALVLDVGKVAEQFRQFVDYVWQFSLLALLLFGYYWAIRYGLVRGLLAQSGVYSFLLGSALLWLTLTPLYASCALWLPVNQLPAGIDMVVPSGNSNPFDGYNYRFMLLMWLLVTPIVLAFERQSHSARYHAIAEQHSKTELQLLQQQINPHFLFNTLNSLYALTLARSEQAPEMVLQLSALLRYTVYQGAQSQVRLAQEVQYLQHYLALQQLRHGQRLTLTSQWPEPEQLSLPLPPLLFIVLVENAFKHGVERCAGNVQLTLSLTVANGQLHFRCENRSTESPVVQPTTGGGLGLDNLARRLALLYPNRHHLRSEATRAGWCAHLDLTLETDLLASNSRQAKLNPQSDGAFADGR